MAELRLNPLLTPKPILIPLYLTTGHVKNKERKPIIKWKGSQSAVRKGDDYMTTSVKKQRGGGQIN